MHFYRPLGKISALSFDLDDTLYDNLPVIEQTVQKVMAFISSYHDNLTSLNDHDFQIARHQVLERQPDIYHDVTAWRHCATEQAMLNAGLSKIEAKQGADAAMDIFAAWRSRIDISPSTHQILQQLSEKWPLVAITNGNAQPHLFGLDKYFAFVLYAGPDGRSKPFADMFSLASQKLNIPLAQLLHIGDDLTTDVAGAVRCGANACWINTKQNSVMTATDSRLLPHVEISQLASLISLL